VSYTNFKRADSAFQRFEAKPVVIAIATAAGAGSTSASFQVPIPDSRLRVKVTIIFVPAAGSTPLSNLSGANATLWLYESETDRSGVSGARFPCSNVEGTSAAPTSIPATGNALYGYSREFTTLADTVEGAFVTGSNGTQAGSWVLQCAYSPDSVRFTPDEWDAITKICNPSLTTKQGSV
jgi:hypothetical protein